MPLTAIHTKSPAMITEVEASVIRTILYFHIFHHPLTAEELYQNCALPYVSRHLVNEALNKLCDRNLLYKTGHYYQPEPSKDHVERRIAGAAEANKYIKRAQFVSNIISRFPYVRAVMISGSLSKGYMDHTTDVDFFIITKQGRLWICRITLACVRKMLILVKPLKKYCCINYFIDDASLKIPDENLFTATEIVYLIPTYNNGLYHAFMQANKWTEAHYPNKPLYDGSINNRSYAFGIKRFTEWIFNGWLGEKLDTLLFRMMLKRWKGVHKDLSEDDFELNFRTKKHVAKHHEKGYQHVILRKHEDMLSRFEKQHHVSLRND